MNEHREFRGAATGGKEQIDDLPRGVAIRNAKFRAAAFERLARKSSASRAKRANISGCSGTLARGLYSNSSRSLPSSPPKAFGQDAAMPKRGKSRDVVALTR